MLRQRQLRRVRVIEDPERTTSLAFAGIAISTERIIGTLAAEGEAISSISSKAILLSHRALDRCGSVV